MKTWLKKGIAASIFLFIFAGCDISNPFNQTPTTPATPDTTIPAAFDSTKATTGIAPYYANGDIEYYPAPKELSADAILSADMKTTIASDEYVSNWGGSATFTAKWEELAKYFHFYEVGTIKAETYKNEKLVVLEVDCDGPCFNPYLYRFAYNQTKNDLTLLSRHSIEDKIGIAIPLTWNSDNAIFYEGIEPPQTIKIPNSDKLLRLQTRFNSYPLSEGDLKFQFADEKYGNLYMHGNTGCLYLKSPDGSTSLYAYNPHFFDGEPVFINWTNNSPQTNLSETYTYVSSACGMNGNCYIIEGTPKDSDFKAVGKASNGIDIYTVNNPTEGAYVDPYSKQTPDGAIKIVPLTPQQQFDSFYQPYKSSYEYNEEAKKKPMMTFEEFVASNSVLYWKDPLGRWTGLIRGDVKPAAECGKPVIYLYPEKTTDVNVKVFIDKLTKTIPAYETNGWTVKADPDGTLYNYSDSKTYPYLFWEGQKNGGATVTKGFTVARENVETFLDESLSKLGLNSSEAKDFKDFWLSRMLENKEPYFFISFLGTSEFNKIAPLKITPAPNTLIRVFMYYMPTFSDLQMPTQELTSIPRKGFTVIEWGGTSSKPWQAE